MLLYSTKDHAKYYTLEEAVMNSLPADNGLYMPKEIPRLAPEMLDSLWEKPFAEIANIVAQTLMVGGVPSDVLEKIVHEAINFPAPLVTLDDDTHILELFHGPSLAFKDFGARFMSRLMGYYNRNADQQLTILVATSGDTGGAVAAGFLGTPGIRVVILYPSGKVSPIQEKQLTTLGQNILAIEVNGTFDDCQALVKQAFLDNELNKRLRLSSANSINIARLIPQSFYYFEAYKQLPNKNKEAYFVVPSGNFGNLTAGLLASRMGLPVKHFVAATNSNDVVPQYLSTGEYQPRASVRTLSNAMDVGSPSNFVRMLDLYGSTWNLMANQIEGVMVSDEITAETMREVKDKHNYILDPHGAVGYYAMQQVHSDKANMHGIILETAHPAKFIEDVEAILGSPIEIPEGLKTLDALPKQATLMEVSYTDFREYLWNLPK